MLGCPAIPGRSSLQAPSNIAKTGIMARAKIMPAV